MSYFTPAVRLIVPDFSCGACATQSLITSTLLIQTRAALSESVVNVYVPVVAALILPVQRTLKVSTPMPVAGEPTPQPKLMLASTRLTVAPVKLMLSKYVAFRPALAVVVVLVT